MPSRREYVRDWVASTLDNIETSGGYRTNPVIHKHFVYPTASVEPVYICVIVESEAWTAQDDNMTDWDSEMKVVLLGRFNSTVNYSGVEPLSGSEVDGEALLHDMKRCLFGIMLSEVNNSTNRRLILGKRGIQCFGPTYYPGNQGEVRMEFYVKVPAQDGDA